MLTSTFLITLIFQGSASLNVLFLHPLYAGSHVLTLQSVTKELLDRGHHVTTVKFSDSNLPTLATANHANFSLVELTVNNSLGELPFVTFGEDAEFRLPLDLIWNSGKNLLWTIGMMKDPADLLLTEFCSKIHSDKLWKLLEQTVFDIAVVDLMFNECGLALTHRLGIPSVGYWAFSFAGGQQEFTTMPAPTSHVPTFMSTLSHNMNLMQRTYNTLAKIAERLFMYYYHGIVNQKLQYLYPGSPPADKLLGNVNGMLINTNNVLDYPRPQPPTFINIGGIQIKKYPGLLPLHIQDFMDSAEHGVVLFTMGFIFDSRAVPKSMINRLLTAFERLPQRVIFKYDSNIPGLVVPPNVLVLPWVPQQAILAHPNTKVFITHCGMHGVLEAIHHQVPMVGMPVFIDQGDVLTRMEEKGIGLGVDKTASSDAIYDTIVKVRDDPSYLQNVVKLSMLLKDRRGSPMDDAVWLIEFLARNEGAEHLKISSKNLNLFEYYSLDSCLIIFCLCSVILTIFYLLAKKVFHSTALLLGKLSDNFASSEKIKIL